MSEGTCDVSIGGYDGDPAEVYQVQVVTARKAHKCGECEGQILPKQQYERVSGKWDGEWQVLRSCLPCREISVEFSEDGRTFGVLWDEMETNWYEGAHLQACLNRLKTVAAKERMRDWWMRWKGLATPGGRP